MMKPDHFTYMQLAISLAQTAATFDEVPVGAVIVHEGHIVGSGFNLREQNQSALCHAEIEAIAQACRTLKRWRLSDCELYVTLEPCIMCAGAIHQARLGHVIYGAMDPKAGAMGSLYHIHEDTRLNHRVSVERGVMEEECRELLQSFFRKKRGR